MAEQEYTLNKIATEEDLILAYLAGAMDSDGFISMRKQTTGGCTTYYEFIGFTQVSDRIPNMLKERFGGYVSCQTRREKEAANRKPTYNWVACAKNAILAIRTLRRYIRIKAEQADLLLELRKSKDLPRSERRNVPVITTQRLRYALAPEVQAHRESLFQRMKALNKIGL